MLAEAAHSAADSVNEVFLAIGCAAIANRRTQRTPSATGASDFSGLSWPRSRRF